MSTRRAGYGAAALDTEQRKAWQEGFEQGRREGRAAGRIEAEAGQRELEDRIDRVGQLIDAMARPLADLDDGAALELAQLSLAAGSQLARRELQLDPAQVIAIIRECVDALPSSARHVRVNLHPADAEIVRGRLSAPSAERAAWSIVEDPVMGRGGCRVLTDVSEVDARLESRVAAVVAAVLGEQRGRVGGAPDAMRAAPTESRGNMETREQT